jgi:exodeoxyribonuclease-3
MSELLEITRPPARAQRPAARGRAGARATTVRLLTFNIGAAAPPRASAILQWLRSRRDDVLVLTETSTGPGTTLLAGGLTALGYRVEHAQQAGERGVLVASRIPVTKGFSDRISVTLPCRAGGVLLDVGAHRIAIVGVYIPSRDRSEIKVSRKREFIASLLASLSALPRAQRAHLVLAGDYNAVARGHEPALPGFFPWEYGLHDELEQFDLRPAHELRPPREQPHSWIGRTGLGYLYDYVHVGSGLHRAVQRCDYLHLPRDQRLSDHAAVAVSLRVT